MTLILVIDDDELVRYVLSQTLAGFGHTVIEARNGKQGLELFYSSRPDLVITDLVMPEMDGLELLLELRNCRPRVKIIVISGGVFGDPDAYLEASVQFGAARALAKPFNNEELIAAVNEVLSDDPASSQFAAPK